MSTAHATGVVLSTISFNDYDRVATIFSSEFGKFTLWAPGVNRPKSKNKYALETFSFSNFEFFKSAKINGLSKLKTGSLISNHQEISRDYNDYQYASSLSFLLESSLDTWQPKSELYRNFLFALDNFNRHYESLKSFIYFMFYSSHFFGGSKADAKCGRCGATTNAFALYHLYDLRLICEACLLPKDVSQDREWVKFIRQLAMLRFPEAMSLDVNGQYVMILGKILLNYYRDSLGLENKAMRLINQKPIFHSITNDLINFLLKY